MYMQRWGAYDQVKVRLGVEEPESRRKSNTRHKYNVKDRFGEAVGAWLSGCRAGVENQATQVQDYGK